jgi:hypothetical protein
MKKRFTSASKPDAKAPVKLVTVLGNQLGRIMVIENGKWKLSKYLDISVE